MASERLQRQIGRLLDEAEEAIPQLNWTVVRARAVLAIDPENSEGLTFLATAERALSTSDASPTTQRSPQRQLLPLLPPHYQSNPPRSLMAATRSRSSWARPSNVWLTSDGTAQSGDFDLAVAADRARLTQEGMLVGTPIWTLHSSFRCA